MSDSPSFFQSREHGTPEPGQGQGARHAARSSLPATGKHAAHATAMIVLFGSDAKCLQALVAAAPPEHRHLATTARDRCVQALSRSMCLVAGVPDEPDPDLALWLRERPATALAPLVVVAHEHAETVRRLAVAAPAEVVWWQRVQVDLGPAIKRAIGSTLLGCVAEAFDSATEIPHRLRMALAVACRASPPILSVAGLARAAGCSDRWLEALWDGAVAGRAYRLKDFMDWLLLMRASLILNDAMPREQVAILVGRDKRTLDNIARRLVETRFHHFRGQRTQDIRELFIRRALAPIAKGSIIRKLT